MSRRKLFILACVLLAAIALTWGATQVSAKPQANKKDNNAALLARLKERAAKVQKIKDLRVTQAEREAAADRMKTMREKAARGEEVTPPNTSLAPLATPDDLSGTQTETSEAIGPLAMDMPMPGPGDTPDYFGCANWAFSPPLRKFVDSLPGIGPDNANNLGQYLSIAKPDTKTYPGSDYYEIELRQYTEQMHSDLPPTTLRGYVQVNKGTDANGNNTLEPDPIRYLGPTIIARKDRPVRVKFTNKLPTGEGGNLFIPVDTTVMGAGMGPLMHDVPEGMPMNYTQNRATLHLHGGKSPWISDGTPHQWITPAGENTPYPKGVSVVDVPDMFFDANGNPVPAGTAGATTSPGDGSMTFYYTNQQSARFMFYHDHSYGITRLNVYAGEAAGYIIEDETEQQLVDDGLIPEEQIPLIIQDKTFVDTATIGMTDPTWNWGTGTLDTTTGIREAKTGDLWMPHVYVPAQNPYDISGLNPYGRWHYGPWFWPPTNNITHGPVPNPYYDPENAPWQPPEIPGTPHPSMGMESFFDTPVINGTAFPTLEVDPKSYRFRILNAANDRFWNLQMYEADTNTVSEDSRTLTEVKMVPASPCITFPDNWPTDGREGGVPDPNTVGPDWIQIGTEGGFLPKPAVVPNQPITWNRDATTFNAGNVQDHSLLLGPAERADVIVDFSKYAGKTLILYNDAPTAFPALDPRTDYYTGAPDMTDTGGHWGPEVGFGPNTRTIMQIKVKDVEPDETFDLDALEAAFASTATEKGVFERGQDPIIVGQSAYNSAYNKTFPSTWPNWGVSRIQDNFLSFMTTLGDTITVPMEPKAIQDEMGEAFDKDYGRMSGFLGLELPGTGAGNQNFVLYPFGSPPVEVLNSTADGVKIGELGDGTQIWKITHNGVDTHPIHFHLYDVQLINRVGWDGAIRLPDENELGWKDTVRVSPLEDTIVALRPKVPAIPFELPNSVRLIDPTMPEGAYLANSTQAELNGLPPEAFAPNGEPIDIINHYVNFGWEYVVHCHILSHEEMDMMHAVAVAVAPKAPTELVGTRIGSGVNRRVNLTWKDNSINETGFTIQRATNAAFTAGLTTFTVEPNVTTYSDRIGNTNQVFYYRVFATNTVGDTWDYTDPNLNEEASFPTKTANSAYSNVVGPPAAPTNVTVSAVVVGTRDNVTLKWTDASNNEAGFTIQRSTNGTSWSTIAMLPANTQTYTQTGVLRNRIYYYRINSYNNMGASAWVNASPFPIRTP